MLKESSSAKLCLLFAFFLSGTKSTTWMKDLIEQKQIFARLISCSFTPLNSIPSREVSGQNCHSTLVVPPSAFPIAVAQKKTKCETLRWPAVISVKVSKDSKAAQLKQHARTQVPTDPFPTLPPSVIFTLILIPFFCFCLSYTLTSPSSFPSPLSTISEM